MGWVHSKGPGLAEAAWSGEGGPWQWEWSERRCSGVCVGWDDKDGAVVVTAVLDVFWQRFLCSEAAGDLLRRSLKSAPL